MKLRITVEVYVGQELLKGYGPWVEVELGEPVLESVQRAALEISGINPKPKDKHDHLRNPRNPPHATASSPDSHRELAAT